MMKHWVPILFVSILVSCTPRTESVPKNLLSEAEMVDALAGVHILESAAKLNLLEGIKSDSLSLQDYYRALFETKSYSLSAFDSSFAFYAKDPEIMERFMDSVLTNIQMME